MKIHITDYDVRRKILIHRSRRTEKRTSTEIETLIFRLADTNVQTKI